MSQEGHLRNLRSGGTRVSWSVNNREQCVADFVDGRSWRAVDHLRVHVQLVSTCACPMSWAMTLPGTPLSCDHDE